MYSEAKIFVDVRVMRFVINFKSFLPYTLGGFFVVLNSFEISVWRFVRSLKSLPAFVSETLFTEARLVSAPLWFPSMVRNRREVGRKSLSS